MKKKIECLVLLIVVLLSSCNNATEINMEDDRVSNLIYTPNFISTADSQVEFQPNGLEAQMTEAENFYYYICENFLYSISKKDGKVRALDNNPDTLDHLETDENLRAESNAYFERLDSVQYVDGKLYVASIENVEALDNPNELNWAQPVIYEVDTEGAGRKAIFRAKKDVYLSMIHRGYIYFASDQNAEIYDLIMNHKEEYEEELQKFSYKIERVPLNNPDAEYELMYEARGELGVVSKMLAIGDRLFFGLQSFELDDDGSVDFRPETSLLAMDLNSKECKVLTDFGDEFTLTIPKVLEDSFVFYKSVGKDLYIAVDDLVKYAEKGNNYTDLDLERKMLISDFDFEIKNEVELYPALKVGLVYSFGKYTIIDNFPIALLGVEERLFRIVNEKGEIVDEIKGDKELSTSLGMDSQYFFVAGSDITFSEDDNATSFSHIYYLDLNKLGSGKLKWEKLTKF